MKPTRISRCCDSKERSGMDTKDRINISPDGHLFGQIAELVDTGNTAKQKVDKAPSRTHRSIKQTGSVDWF